jgi:hypothetical protein
MIKEQTMFGAAVLMLGISNLFTGFLTAEQILKSSCRIQVDNSSFGSGTVFKETTDKYYIITAGHVVTNIIPILHQTILQEGKDIEVVFFDGVGKSTTVKAKIVSNFFLSETNFMVPSAKDLCIISIEKKNLRHFTPTVIPLANEMLIFEGKNIKGVGWAHGAWPTYWQGRIIKHNRHVTYINMKTLGGQSGSAILMDTPNGTRIVSIINWSFGRFDGYGGGISLKTIKSLIRNEIT